MVKWLLGLLCGQSQAALTSSKAALTIPYCIKKKSTRPLLWRLKFGFGTWLYESPSASPSNETGFRKRSSRHKTANAVVCRSNDFLSGCMRLRRESKEFLEKFARPSGHVRPSASQSDQATGAAAGLSSLSFGVCLMAETLNTATYTPNFAPVPQPQPF